MAIGDLTGDEENEYLDFLREIIDSSKERQIFWKNMIERIEELKIIHAEEIAEDASRRNP